VEEPDWALAGQVVSRAIDQLRLPSDAAIAERFDLDIDTIKKVLENGYVRGPQRETLNRIDETLTAAEIDGWYVGRTRQIAYHRDRRYSMYALTEEEYSRLQAMRDEHDAK
jgi:hypothetical protein